MDEAVNLNLDELELDSSSELPISDSPRSEAIDLDPTAGIENNPDVIFSKRCFRNFLKGIRTKAFWKKNWWIGLGYIPLAALLIAIGAIFLLLLVFGSAQTNRGFVFLWFLIAAIIVEALATGIYCAFPRNRNLTRYNLKRRAVCIAFETFVLFWIVQGTLILIMPSAFLFASAPWNEIGTININLKSPNGFSLQQEANCNVTAKLAPIQRFYGCSLDVSLVDFYFGGEPVTMPQLEYAGVTLFRNIFLMDPKEHCPTYSLLTHELFHVYQTEHKMISISKYITQELYLQLTIKWKMYDYGGMAGVKQSWIDGKSFDDFNPEQQARMVEDYYYYRSIGTSNATLQYYSNYIDPLLAKCL
jgi:hypothetical protein